jgi:TolB-like protein/DNA-binding winged helix-turn-helix (wHTH) protein/Flp pilus assembly protein TadD
MAQKASSLDNRLVMGRRWRFANCEFDELRHELRVDGKHVDLESRPLEVLRQLLLRSGEVVTKSELLESAWPDTNVVDASLATAISKLRKAMRDERADIVLTVPRIGYRLGVPAEQVADAEPRVAPTRPSSSPPLVIPDRKNGRNLWALAGLMLVLVAAGVYLFHGSKRRPASTTQISSIAVLPFANISGDPAQDYLADGMTEALITELSRIQALKVISRTTVMQYKGAGKPLPVVAQELGVDGVVDGAIQRSGNRLRITVRLIDAKSDANLWAESYDRDFSDILILQRELARQISQGVHVTIEPLEEARLSGSRRVDPKAQELYLRGRAYWNQRTPDSLYRAAEYFREVNEIDPNDPRGYTGLADTFVDLVAFGDIDPAEGIVNAKAAAQKAIALDDSLAEAHASLAHMYALEWNWVDADREYRRSIELNPGYVVALYEYAFVLSWWGRDSEAVALANKAIELDPLSPIVLYRAGRVHFHARRYDKAIDLYKRVLTIKPNDEMGLFGAGTAYEAEKKFPQAIAAFGPPYRQSGFDLATAYAAAGDKVEARRAFDRELRRLQDAKLYVRPGYIAEFYANLGDKEEALRWLERAYREHDAWLALLKVWPRFDPLRSDPRFQDILRRLKFPD